MVSGLMDTIFFLIEEIINSKQKGKWKNRVQIRVRNETKNGLRFRTIVEGPYNVWLGEMRL